MHVQAAPLPLHSAPGTITDNRSRTVYGCGPRLTIVNLGVSRSLISWLAARDYHLTILPAAGPRPESGSMLFDALIVAGSQQLPTDAGLLDCLAEAAAGFPVLGIGTGLDIVVRVAGGTPARQQAARHCGEHIVIDRESGRTFVTRQDHRVSVTAADLDGTGLVPVQHHAGDGTIEAVVHPDRPLAGIYYHPESGHEPCTELLSRFLSGLRPSLSRRHSWYHRFPGQSS